MKFLLDTHTFLWLESERIKLSATALRLVSDADNSLLLSYVSLWEIQIKTTIEKLHSKLPFS